MTNKEETDITESQIVRASVLESHGWSSEQNRSQCKFRNKFSCFFVILIFSFRSSLLLFILRDKGVKRIPIGARRDHYAIEEIFTSANMTMMELDT